ncbi:MAG: glucose-6-phosphate isomerase [Treponema sp.]|nr:glucose-6-phosphate isomerase [Treponema sp.]
MNFTDLDKTKEYRNLLNLAQTRKIDLSSILTAERVRNCVIPFAAGLKFNWAARAVDDAVLNALQTLSDEQELVSKYRLLAEGATMNTTENRLVLHHLARSPDGKSVTGTQILNEGKDIGAFYRKELKRFSAFADKVRAGEIRPAADKVFSAVCQIGIGGSDLGPRAMVLALQTWAKAEGRKQLQARFISNVDPDDASLISSELPLEQTLFILVSKSGTTLETLTNELFVKNKLKKAGLDPAKHMVAVTSETSPLANNPGYLDSFYIDDFIGGRYSSASAAGGVIISLVFGSDVFEKFLAGAHEADKAALEKDIRKNACLLDALIGIWERNFLKLPCTTVLPYSQGLSRFPAHLQQLDMESNGKRVNRDGRPVSYETGPVVFGEPGTNGQHSFYQLLHQGTSVVPLQFVGFAESQLLDDLNVEGSDSQTKLNANLAAQIVAFAKGKKDTQGAKDFPGNKPSSLIYGKRLEPGTLGALLAFYENKIMFQGFAWNINSFDQEGVQLGKVLAKKILEAKGSGSGDAVLDAYAGLLGS